MSMQHKDAMQAQQRRDANYAHNRASTTGTLPEMSLAMQHFLQQHAQCCLLYFQVQLLAGKER